MYVMRFDLRAPGHDAAQRAALYRAAIDMSAWADERGVGSIVLSEHHSSEDGYLSSPLVLASAVAAVTRNTGISIAAALLPLYSPVRLAEEIITLDHISQGRVMHVLGLGYRPEEYELYGLDYSRRGAIADEKLAELLELLRTSAGPQTGSPRVTPPPFTSPMPMLCWGGQSRAAARRAGRFGIGFFAQTNSAGLKETYRESAAEHGHTPGLCFLPDPDTPMIVFVAEDPDRAWDEIGESLLVDAAAYHGWNEAAGHTRPTASMSVARTVDELREGHGSHRIVTPQQARDLITEHGVLGLHPLCGGLDPEVGWRYLRTAIDAVSSGHSPK